MQDFLMWGFGIFVTLCTAFSGFVWKMHKRDIDMLIEHIDKADERSTAVEKNIERHKLYAANTFATKTDVNLGFNRILENLRRMEDKNDRYFEKLEEKINKEVKKQ